MTGLLMATAMPAPAAAGEVSALSFVGQTSVRRTEQDGVVATRGFGFTLYDHGARLPEVRSDSGFADEPEPAPAAVAEQLADPCGLLGVPPVRAELSIETAARRQTYWPIVRAAECRNALPEGLLDAVVITESRYAPVAVSRAGAVGLTQLMPLTATGLGVPNRFDPVANVDGGARYLRSLLDRYLSVSVALAAYNAGPGAVDRARGIPDNAETPNYVRRVLASWSRLAAAQERSVDAPLSSIQSFRFTGN